MMSFQLAVRSAGRTLSIFVSRSRQVLRSLVRTVGSGASSRHPKLFFIGFNKCGTKTLHHFFRRNGYLCIHSRSWWAKHTHGLTAAQMMKDNQLANRPILAGLSRYEVFSDLNFVTDSEIIEANSYFREMHQDHPDAYFVFNDRPVKNWIRSRLSHEGGKHGSFVKKFENALKLSRDEVIAFWEKDYERHKKDVVEYFQNHPRFMIYNIETDKPDRLLAFLSNDFNLNASMWEHRGSSQERLSRQLAKRAR
jgi:hypothetical protein